MKLLAMLLVILASIATNCLASEKKVQPQEDVSYVLGTSGAQKQTDTLLYEPVKHPTNQEQAAQKREQEQYQKENAPDRFNAPYDIAKNSWAIPLIYRWYKRHTELASFKKDPNFLVTSDFLDSLPIMYSLADRSRLRDTTSKAQYNAVSKHISEDTTIQQAAVAHGPTMNMVVTLLDPPKLVLIILVVWFASKGFIRLCRVSMNLGRATTIQSLSLGIKGTRKVKGAIDSIWSEAKEADRKSTDL